jgi:hypothetical protein
MTAEQPACKRAAAQQPNSQATHQPPMETQAGRVAGQAWRHWAHISSTSPKAPEKPPEMLIVENSCDCRSRVRERIGPSGDTRCQ